MYPKVLTIVQDWVYNSHTMEIKRMGIKDARTALGDMPFGYKFVVGEREEGNLELALYRKPPPGPNHKDIAEAARFLIESAKGGMLMISLDNDGLKYVEGGYSTTLPSGGASEEDFKAALASGMLWLVEE